MKHESKKRLANLAVRFVGGVALLAAAFGLYYNGYSLVVALQGGFDELQFPDQEKIRFSYLAFFIMSGICVVCYILLIVCGIDLLKAGMKRSGLLILVLIFEVLYFFSICLLFSLPNVGLNIAGALGVANGGLMVQFVILFPLWAPLVLWWAKSQQIA